MAKKKPDQPSSRAERPSAQPSSAEVEAQREKERRQIVETLGGYGMPLDELGLLLVPPISGAEVARLYALELEQGKAKSKANLVQLIWATAAKNATMQIYLSKVMLGWNEKSGPDAAVPEPGTPEAEAANNNQMPTAERLMRDFIRGTPRSRAP